MLLVRSKFLNKNLDSRRFALRSFICYWTSFEIRNYTFVYNLDRIVRLIKAKNINSFVANFNLIFHLSAITWIRYNDDIYLRSIFFQNVRFVNRFLISLRIIFTKRGTIYIEIDFLISNQIEDRTVSSALDASFTVRGDRNIIFRVFANDDQPPRASSVFVIESMKLLLFAKKLTIDR